MPSLQQFRAAGALCVLVLLIALRAALPTLAQGTTAHVLARVETGAVSGGDPDDMAIWIHPGDPSLSLVIGADTLKGVFVYDLAGNTLQNISADGGMNNIDLRYNFLLGGQRTAIVAASNLTKRTISFYKVNAATRQLENVSARVIPLPLDRPYGFCMYHSTGTGKYYAITTNTAGLLEQWEMFESAAGKVDAVLVRSLDVGQGNKTEGCVADDVLGHLYVGEDDFELWKYGAEPSAGSTRTRVDWVGSGGNLLGSVEGLSIYYKGNGTGYLIASNQTNNTFIAYTREGANSYLGRFDIVDNGAIDGVSATDGVDVSNFPLNTEFPSGMIAVHDGLNTPSGANFKFASWADTASGLGLTSDTSWDPRAVGTSSPQQSTPTPTSGPSPTATRTPTPTPSPTLTHTPTPLISPTATHTPNPAHSPTPTLTPTPTASITLTPSPTATGTPTPVVTQTSTPATTQTAQPAGTSVATPTHTPTIAISGPAGSLRLYLPILISSR
jgi:3-phytase